MRHLHLEEVASDKLEWVWRAFAYNLILQVNVDHGYDAEKAPQFLSATTDTWTNGSMVKDEISLVCAAGAGMFSDHSSDVWSHGCCEHLETPLVSVMVPLDPCKPFKELICWLSFWLFNLVHLLTLVVIIPV